MAPVSSKEFPDIRTTIECRFTLKLVRVMIITYSQMYRTDKSTRNIVQSFRLVWLNDWAFVYELNGSRFESRYCHLLFCMLFNEWYKYGINQDQKNLFHKGLLDIVKGWSTNIYLKTLNFSHVFWRIILEKCLIKASDFT